MSIDPSTLPLAINMVGPMAFKRYQKTVEVWLPILGDQRFPHQAGIGSNVQSRPFDDSKCQQDYVLNDPPAFSSLSTVHNPAMNVPYEATPKIFPPKSFFIHLILPNPKYIEGLSPVSCEIYTGTGTGNFQLRPVGFRLLYDKTGHPTLSSGGNPIYSLKFDPSPGDTTNEMIINYAPFNAGRDHTEAQDDFKKLAAMFGLNLTVDFDKTTDDVRIRESVRPPDFFVGPVNDCKSPNITLV
jgi:hypothetical protein